MYTTKANLLFLLVLISTNLGANTFQTEPENLETEIKYLSGTGKDDTVQWDFFCSAGRKSGTWSSIAVPSCWEQEGFGAYNYGHDAKNGKTIHDEYGIYKHKFSVPAAWKKKNITIVFEGVMTDAEVKINGKLAGEIHQGAFYEFKYNITDLLQYGEENLLEVEVHKVSANASVNAAERNADFWIFGGIYRPVYLQVSPKDHIQRLAIDAKADGTIHTDLFISSKKANSVKLFLTDQNGDQPQDLPVNEMNKKEDRWSISSKAENIKSWNPEQPNLYLLNVEILNKKNEVLHRIKERIGFRTIEVLDGDGIYVNGQRIKFKGVNRHSFYPSSGRTTSKTLSIEHVKMMKDMNMNAVRMSHYPPDVHFLEACDSLGLFVIDEVCTWHSPHLDTEVGRKIVKETVVRDVNHPSILLWANGNETGWNTELDDDYAIWDIQQREVIHPWNIFRKTNTLHYFSYHGLANDGYAKDKIFFPTEFLHGLYDGGHGAGLDDYWKQMWQMPLSAGGFLWDFADEAIERTDQNGALDTDGNHAADGIVGPYGEKEASYFTIKEVWSPIYIEDRYIKTDFNGVFRVENRYHYTNLNQIKLRAKWVQFDGPKGNTDLKVISKEEIKFTDLPPGAKGEFQVVKPDNWQSADALYITATDPGGKEIFTWSYPVKVPKEFNRAKTDLNIKGEIKADNKDGYILVESNGINFQFSEKNGLLKQINKSGTVIPFNDGPVILGQNDKIESVDIKSYADKIEITTLFEMTDKSPNWATHKEYSSDMIKWTIYANGLLGLEVHFKGKRIVDAYKGISFSFPETEVKGMKWLGDGPYRVWRNRMKGTRFAVWENDYNDTVTGDSGYVYPEFKGFFSSLYWAEIRGKNNNGFRVYCNSPNTFLRMLTPTNPVEERDPNQRVSPTFPEGDISFVKNIPAIGTKFQKGEQMGPQGNTENYFGNDDDPIIIDLIFEF